MAFSQSDLDIDLLLDLLAKAASKWLPDLDEVDFSLTRKEKANRFPRPLTDCEMHSLLDSRVPGKTKEKNTGWSMSVFDAWRKFRMMSGVAVPDLQPPLNDELNQTLASCIVEARRQDDQGYPPNTLYNLMCGLQRHLREVSGDMSVNLVDYRVHSAMFRRCRNALDARMKQLSR